MKRMIIAIALALTLLATAPLAFAAVNGSASAVNTQQGRIIQHATEHLGQKRADFDDLKPDPLNFKLGQPWCAWFIQHCSYKADLGKLIPTKYQAGLAVTSLATDIVNNKKGKITFVNKTSYNHNKGKFTESRCKYNKNYKPRKGDIIVFTNYQVSGSYLLSHCGFVYADCDKALKGVKTIEGNTKGKDKNWEKTSVVYKRSKAGDTNKERRIAGYITPNYCKHASKNIDKKAGICTACKASYVYFDKYDKSMASSDSGYHYTTVTEAAIRVYPLVSADQITTIPGNTEITVMGRMLESNFFKVKLKLSGKTRYGYIAGTDVLIGRIVDPVYDGNKAANND